MRQAILPSILLIVAVALLIPIRTAEPPPPLDTTEPPKIVAPMPVVAAVVEVPQLTPDQVRRRDEAHVQVHLRLVGTPQAGSPCPLCEELRHDPDARRVWEKAYIEARMAPVRLNEDYPMCTLGADEQEVPPRLPPIHRGLVSSP